jgi:CHAT domain-containing protein
MPIAHVIGIVVLGSMLGSEHRGATGQTFDECLRIIGSGPDSFGPYFCLGTPGLPDRAPEVRAALGEVLRHKPHEPHARLYLALMATYDGEEPDEAEFTEPIAIFERRGAVVDLLLSRLALVERKCSAPTCCGGCGDALPLLESAARLADTVGDPYLVRLVRLTALRRSFRVGTTSDAKLADDRLGPTPEHLPSWLIMPEVSIRASLATWIGDDLRARDLYESLVSIAPQGTVTHASASAGLAEVTARLAWRGLASREQAERLLRASLIEQQEPALGRSADPHIAETLALLLGRNPETISLVNEAERTPLTIEFLLQGTLEERARALSYAREKTDGPGMRPMPALIARAHAEFWAGSRSAALHWAQRAIRGEDRYRETESIEEMRIRGDWLSASPYQIVITDLLDREPGDPDHLRLALDISERLRSRILLEKVVRRRGWFAGSVSPPSLTEIQSVLDPTEAVISFLVWRPRPNTAYPYVRGHSWALVVTKNQIAAVRIVAGELLEPAVRAWTQQVDARAPSLERGTSRLYRDLIEPVLSALPSGVHSLTLIPDGPLHRLPFDALSEAGARPYLAERYRIAIVPSIAIWLELRKQSRSPPGLALAFANTPEGPAARVAEMRGEVGPGQLGVLLRARDEAQEAVNAFPVGSRLFAGAEATRDQLTPDVLKRASLVHFAAHGVLDALHPDDSFLLLAPGAAGSGMFKLADVPRFDWSGKTIVLSACETSAGAFRVGEGVLSLARGFFAGGATAVIGTLSRVRDDEQYELVKRFYRELRTGASVGDALTAAKRSLIAEGAPPAAWANVVLLGDGTIRPLGPFAAPTSAWRRPELAVVLGIVVAALGLVVLRRWTRKPTSA